MNDLEEKAIVPLYNVPDCFILRQSDTHWTSSAVISVQFPAKLHA
jgi:hypothetical protein